MRLYDGLQRFELYTLRDSLREPGQTIPAREFAAAVRRGPVESRSRIGEFLVREFGWHPADVERQEATLDRLVQLIESEQVAVVSFRPSGSIAGDVPDEDDVQELTELAEEEDEAVDARLAVEPPMAIEPAFDLAPPDGFDVGFEIEDPQMPAFEFEVG